MGLKTINLTVAFLLELCALAALAYWGVQTGSSTILKVFLGVGTPLLAALIWGRFMAPTSKTRLRGTAYLLLKVAIFGVAAVALAIVGQVTLAILFAVASIVNHVLLVVWHQEAQASL